MAKFALLLTKSTDGVAKDVVRAVPLYERATISAKRHINALACLALPLCSGTGSRQCDALHAISFHETAIEKRKSDSHAYADVCCTL